MNWTHLNTEAKSVVAVTQFKVQKVPCFFGNILAELLALFLHIVDEISGEKGARD